MSEPMLCCRGGGYCARCDLLVGLDGLRVSEVARDAGGALTVTVESEPAVMGCPTCGAVAHAHGRVVVRLVDAPAFGRPVRIRWVKRRWVCPDPDCPAGTFVEQNAAVASPRASLTVRACWWAIGQLRREHASVNGIRRQFGTGWRTVWAAIKPLLQAADGDPARFEGVTTLGVDEHIVRHEALLFRMEVRDLHRLAVAAAG
jgi:transposase